MKWEIKDDTEFSGMADWKNDSTTGRNRNTYRGCKAWILDDNFSFQSIELEVLTRYPVGVCNIEFQVQDKAVQKIRVKATERDLASFKKEVIIEVPKKLD